MSKLTVKKALRLVERIGLDSPEKRASVGCAWPPLLADSIRLAKSVDVLPPPPEVPPINET